ncbi:uncharacterized protein CC84DRAFT_790620 [Paraphaeosphaeria sporulosa]|uniref:Uncharacterized protein n=1 Tax=Paraphaeosphaeria sporulosa TaxID=1460663 RepID=A0A177C9E0_9PLEO|nr:uncharacterized protein CC84DRAFT_790620 [Paraphaeosphaeria sporulosa]OAG04364.1 hypothetical protein CC84DRAFT_790620 [Paraphaeosphaeria sporulosa]
MKAVTNRRTSRPNTTKRARNDSRSSAYRPLRGTSSRRSPHPQIHGTVSPAPKSRIKPSYCSSLDGASTIADSAHCVCELRGRTQHNHAILIGVKMPHRGCVDAVEGNVLARQML